MNRHERRAQAKASIRDVRDLPNFDQERMDDFTLRDEEYKLANQMVLDFMASLEAKFGDRSIPVVTSIIATELGHLLQTAAWPYILICVNRCLQIMLENKGYQPVQLASLRAAAGVVDMQARKEGTTH